MSFPYNQQYMDYSNPTTPIGYPWDVDPNSASISPEALQHPLQTLDQSQAHSQHTQESVGQIHHQQSTSATPTPAATTPAPATPYDLQTIHLQERVPPSQFRFDNINESHFQKPQETPPRASTSRSSSKRPSSLRVSVDQSRPHTASSLGPTRTSQNTRQHGHSSHPYRRVSDGTTTGTGGERTQTGSRRASHPGVGESCTTKHHHHREFDERQSRLGTGSDGSLVGVMLPSGSLVGTGQGTSTASCPAMHTWRVNQTVAPDPSRTAPQPTNYPQQTQRDVSSVAPMHRPEVTSPVAISTAHTPGATEHTPTVPTPELPPSVQQMLPTMTSLAQELLMQPPLFPASVQHQQQHQHRQAGQQPAKRYNIRTDVHFDPATNFITAMLELPGLKKSDLEIILGRCPYSRVRQVTICGVSKSMLPDQGYQVKERKFGAFWRTMIVPPETEASDVEAFLEDGILTLRVPGGTPAEGEGPQKVAIR